MMEIRISKHEVDVSDSVSGFRGKVRALVKFLDDEHRDRIIFSARHGLSPASYDRCLLALEVRKDSGQIWLREGDGVLIVSGSAEFLRMFTSYLDFPEGSGPRDYRHFDRFGDEEYIHPESLPAVFGIIDTPPNT